MVISVVVPCFNEEESIPLFYREMERVRMKMGEKFEYIFINDGSSDGTLSVLRKLHVTDSNVHYLSFSRNFGKEAALYAGLERASGEYVTVMDVDLQDPPELLIEMKQKLEEQPDLDCVGTRRVTRDGEPPIRSFFARMFYKLINHISQVEMVDGARDFSGTLEQYNNGEITVRLTSGKALCVQKKDTAFVKLDDFDIADFEQDFQG